MKKALITFAVIDGILTLVALCAGAGYVIGHSAGVTDANLVHRAEIIEAKETAWQQGYNAAEVDQSVLRTQEPIPEADDEP